MARYAQLSRSRQTYPFVARHGEGFRLVIEVTEVSEMPREIFGFQQRLMDPYTALTEDEFCFVCSPFDLTYYPVNEPDPAQSPPFFRKHRIDVIVPSAAIAEDVWTIVNAEVCALVEALNRKDRLEQDAVVVCGDDSSDDDSASDSTSYSDYPDSVAGSDSLSV